MNNPLTAPVQIINLSLGVWYSPAGFPTVETNADVIDRDGDLLLVSNGWRYKIISAQQVTRILRSRALEGAELWDVEAEAYDAAPES